ncbi:MAG TPA: plasma-membrane proton-efflux P-type ATPase [Ktedonobacterales bacterium]
MLTQPGRQLARNAPAPARQHAPQAATPERSETPGLTTAEAQRRLERVGYNEVVQASVRPLPKLLSYFWGPIPWMIEAAVIVNGLVRNWPMFVLVLGLLIITGAVRYWEEYQARNLVSALKVRLAPHARVRRDGSWVTLPAREVVPGDLVRVRLGDVVPADARVLTGEPIEVDESTLTGESLPVVCGEGDTLYCGSIVRRGAVEATVLATGPEAYFGKTAQLVQESRPSSHLQRTILAISNYLTGLAVALAAVILVVAVIQRDPFLDALEFALMMIVAAIPADMPTVLAITVAAGARLIARREAIVSRLDSVEELARMDVLCADKTGTLTLNQLSVGEPHGVDGATAADVLWHAALASRAEDRDTIDLAILAAQRNGRQTDESRAATRTITRFEPFDPATKRSEATVEEPDGRSFKVTKGAVQVILTLADNASNVEDEVRRTVDDFGAKGFRALGVARTDERGQWQMVGVIPLHDPLRPDASATIESARQLGVDVKMVTGDQLAIAREIAREAGLHGDVVDAGIFDGSQVRSTTLAATLDHIGGVAQVFPEHKHAIVDALRRTGHTVGMTGDGVNDVPALKKADVGITVSGATDAARAAADIVLLAPGLSAIITAITTSRSIVERMRTYVIYHAAETTRTVLFLGVLVTLFDVRPLTPIMLGLMSALNAGTLVAIAYDRAHASNKPVTWSMPVVLGVAAVLGLASVGASVGLYFLANYAAHLGTGALRLDVGALQTVMFLALSLGGQLTIFVTRVRGPLWSSRPGWMLIAVVLGVQAVATLIATSGLFMAGISWLWVLVIWGYDLSWLLIEDRLKLVTYSIMEPRRPVARGWPWRRT